MSMDEQFLGIFDDDRYDDVDTGAKLRDTAQTSTNHDILGLENEVQVKTRKKLVTLGEQKLLSKDGLPYIYTNRKKLKFLHSNKSDYNPKDYTTHYTYRNLSTILQFYQLWAHKLFPKLRFKDAIMLANRKVAGESKNVRYYRRTLVEREINELFPDEAIEVASQRDDIDVALSPPRSPLHLSDNEMNSTVIQESLVPESNGLFVGDDDTGDQLYTVSAAGAPSAVSSAPAPAPAPAPVASETSKETLQEPEQDVFPDDDDEFMNLTSRARNKRTIEEEIPDPEDIQDYEDEMDVLREMGM